MVSFTTLLTSPLYSAVAVYPLTYDFVPVPGREGLWDAGHYRDGTTVYTSKEELEKQLADEIRLTKQHADYCKSEIDAFWKGFLKKKPEADYDDELRIIRNWTESIKLTD